MNTRMRELRKFYLTLGKKALDYTWYINNDDTVSTEFYFGTKPKTKAPEQISGKPVTILGCTTYCNNQIIAEVIIPETVTEIE